jgi:hypothetical protein
MHSQIKHKKTSNKNIIYLIKDNSNFISIIFFYENHIIWILIERHSFIFRKCVKQVGLPNNLLYLNT